jgi:hypothetical protein
MPQEPTSQDRLHRHHTSRESKVRRWLYRVRNSRREKRKLLQLLILVAAVLVAFLIGFYYFGPSFSNSGLD